jgi:hypothetical protein
MQSRLYLGVLAGGAALLAASGALGFQMTMAPAYITIGAAGTQQVGAVTTLTGAGAPAASAPAYITGIPVPGGPVSQAAAPAQSDTHEGVTWGDALNTDLLDLGDAKLGLKYYGATSGTGTTHSVGLSLTIPE